jgi:hypothetical protein
MIKSYHYLFFVFHYHMLKEVCWRTSFTKMDSFNDSAERQLQDSNLRPYADRAAQREQDQASYSAASESLDQPSNARLRRTSGVMSSDQTVPNLPDEPTIRAQPPIPVLKPYYSVISDVTKSSTSPATYYPRVRYIFNDDDPDLLTEAFSTQREATQLGINNPSASATSTSESQTRAASRAQRLHVPDRALLLNLDTAPDGQGYIVACANSLSADWAVIGAQVQHLRAGSSGALPGDQTMILHIQGSGLLTGPLGNAGIPRTTNMLPALDGTAASLSRDEKNAIFVGEYDTLVRSFEKRLALLRNAAQNSDEAKLGQNIA